MPCANPMIAVPSGSKTKNGKVALRFLGSARRMAGELRFKHERGWSGSFAGSMLLPCRQCISCRLDKSRQWAVRLMHQTKFHASCGFLTLTYDNDCVPKDRSLNKFHLRTFFKDLRARLDYLDFGKIKFFAVGEYGEKTGRPHYHAVLFSDGFILRGSGEHDVVSAESARGGGSQFVNSLVSDVWKHGLHRVSEVNFESAAYVARYSLKKVTGDASFDYYGGRQPEFQSASNGLGKDWFNRWSSDVFPADQIILPRRDKVLEVMPPEYYMRLLEKSDPGLFLKVKEARKVEAPSVEEFYQGFDDRVREDEFNKYKTAFFSPRSL